jgi:hypothetical protein
MSTVERTLQTTQCEWLSIRDTSASRMNERGSSITPPVTAFPVVLPR